MFSFNNDFNTVELFDNQVYNRLIHEYQNHRTNWRSHMKVFFQIVAWLGVLIIALAVAVAYDAGGYNVDMYGFGLMVAAIICLVGVYLLLLGGFKSRSLFLWIITLIAGITYLVVLPRVWMPHNKIGGNVGWLDWRLSLMSAFPGLACVVGGILMRWHVLRHLRNPIQTSEDK